jgi:ATP-dependent exoDNAse (exonuclease V) alpha subunit
MRYQEYFGLDAVHIVDEASMLSHEVSVGDYAARFGTGSVLNDLMASTNPYKIVFVGDPCQLPPVARTPFSAALDVAFLSRTYGVKGSSFVLREILRQQSGNEILKMAGYYRDGILSEAFLKYPKINISQNHTGHAVLHSDEASLIQAYVARIQQHGLNAQVMLTNSNWKSFEVNNKIRAALGKTAPLAVGDLLMVAQNNYLVPLTNGDQVEVLEIQGTEKHAGMQLLQVVVRSLANGQSYETKLIADFVHHSEASLPKEMMQQLLIEFDTRMRRLGITPKTEAYNKAMRSDPHLNALRAKFGYCITCHKSQGGEWQEVFLLIHKSVFAMRDAALYRWFYTALTRAREKLHLHRDWWVVQY